MSVDEEKNIWPLKVCKDFDGEGTGRQSFWEFNDSIVGQPYGFLSYFHDGTSADKIRISSWVHRPGHGWKVISTMETKRREQNWHSDLYSFVESWDESDGPISRAERWADFGPIFFRAAGDKTWAQDTVAELSYKTTDEDTLHLGGEVHGGAFGMGTGGNLSLASEEPLAVTGESECPDELAQVTYVCRLQLAVLQFPARAVRGWRILRFNLMFFENLNF